MGSEQDASYSDRGFRQQKPIQTDYGHGVRVYESSAAEEPCLWLAIEQDDERAERLHLPKGSAHAHLTLDQARAVRDALDDAITNHYQLQYGEGGEINEPIHCWRHLRRHRFEDTRALRIVGGPFSRGRVLRCRICGHETAAVGARLERLLEIGDRP